MKELVNALYQALLLKVMSGKASKAEIARFENVTAVLSNSNDDGRIGKAFEMLNVADTSRKAYVAAQGKIDGYFYLDGKRKPVEYKTNGGRIGSLYKMTKPESAYIIYSMDFETRQTYRKDGTPRPTKHYTVAPVILKVSDFLAILEHCGATKVIEHKGKGDKEIAVQGDSAKLAKCLADYPITFDPNTKYTTEDFEDLELW